MESKHVKPKSPDRTHLDPIWSDLDLLLAAQVISAHELRPERPQACLGDCQVWGVSPATVINMYAKTIGTTAGNWGYFRTTESPASATQKEPRFSRNL